MDNRRSSRERASAVLALNYERHSGGPDQFHQAVDIIADIMHLADDEDWNIDEILASAFRHHDAEVVEEKEARAVEAAEEAKVGSSD